MITQERLRELLFYDEDTGDFTWKEDRNPKAQEGDVAGCLKMSGYVEIKIEGTLYYAHRLAFLYVDGSFPIKQTDHKNGEKSDNRWCNLRRVDARGNATNREGSEYRKARLEGALCPNV